MRCSMTAAVMLLAVLAMTAPAQERRLFKKGSCPPTPYAPCLPGTPTEPRSPLDPSAPLTPPVQPPPSTSPFQEALASAGEAGTQPGRSLHPGMFGDLLGGCTMVDVFFPELDQTLPVCIPTVAQASGIKIAESDSPRPVNRFYYLYNFYGAISTSPDPTVPLLNVHRHMLGFEKTLLGGDASIGMRLPFFSFTGSPGYDTGFTGDLTVITKYALVNNASTGNVLSGGLVVTAPTGASPGVLQDSGGRPRMPRNFPVILQPYAGYIYNPTSRVYLHGFHSVLVPTDANEPTFMANDIGLGLWLYRNPEDQFIRGILPTVEIHVNTPFNHRDPALVNGQTQMLDSVNLTAGFYVLLARSVLGGAVGVPLANGPHRIEALASYTLRF